MKEKGVFFMKRLLALLLSLVMVFSLFSACERDEEPQDTPVETTASSEAETTVETTQPPEREPLIPPLEEGADVLTFRYEEQYLNLYYEKLAEYEDLAINGDDYSKLEAMDPDMEELLQFLMDQSSIAMVLYYCDTEDEEASDLYLDMTDMLTEVQEKTIESMRNIYNSESKLKDKLFEDWTEEEIQSMLDYDSEVKEIEQRYSEIVVEYQDMDEDELEKGIGPLYAEVVANYNRMAQIYGYDNYYEYSYEKVYDRDYSADEAAQMREYAKTYLIPAFKEAYESFSTKLMELYDDELEELQSFLFDDYDDLDYLELYLNALPEDVSADMRTVFDGNSVFPRSRDAMPGAFTTMISGSPFCFFSRDYRDTATLVHEMGHYYGGLYCDLDMVPLDLAEVQSQGNEWLMISYMEEEMSDDVYQCYLDYRILNDITTILVSMIIDEFEHRVYTAEGVENFDANDFDAIMKEVCEEYGGIDFVEENFTNPQYYWRMVALEHPVYYISYAVSLIPSLDMYFEGEENWDEALGIYLKLTRDLEEEVTFLGALESAGLASPFVEDVYAAIAERYEVDLEEES